MSSMEEMELEKRRDALERDVAALIDKYLKAVEWDVPEADEAKARQLIFAEIRAAIGRIEGRS